MNRIFQQSIENREKIIIYYLDNQNKLTQRIIRIVKMNEEMLVAYCYWRKNIRTFKKENILSAGTLAGKVGA